MAASPAPPPSPAAARDPRVQCCSRRGLGEVMALCAPFVRALAQGQPGGDAAVGDALGSFETAVRENVTINGQPWEVTLDDSLLQSGSNIKILEDQFDELIVETAAKRKQWPKKILVHAVQTMKAEQEMLKLYQPVVTPEKIRSQPSQDAYIADLKQVTETASKQISGTMKSLPVLIERAEGFSQALTWQPILELCKLRHEVFAGCKAKEDNNVQSFVSPGEVTPTDTLTSKNPCVLLKRKKVADPSERRRYPLRQRKITFRT
ncbi:kinetochore-associated protein NSL1 homolog isoform X2 [Falco biarmicus]|uniref:kinetochore-associated protein NSL1 homolog isoform X2 n=1 Tax=Falco biarmicus TaxID=345155 RepID=UPI0024BC8E3F|nr:kinetochore-associated protein NSL1 homolog isoform X2 [Falco biarmicus]XP_056213119.1 kinetochore-associated protein NSL1 homolog isoform X2 [Falco biarmicus]